MSNEVQNKEVQEQKETKQLTFKLTVNAVLESGVDLNGYTMIDVTEVPVDTPTDYNVIIGQFAKKQFAQGLCVGSIKFLELFMSDKTLYVNIDKCLTIKVIDITVVEPEAK